MSAKVTVAYGDGIGPEIMEATIRVLKEAKADITLETIEVGENYYKKGYSSGIPSSAWESIERTKVILKAPITTPQGGGYKSLNVTMRKALGLYANIRPCVALHPFVPSNHPDMNVVIIRENEEDLYSGIEYRQTHNMYQTLKLVTKVGSEKIIRFAFEYAIKNGRKKVTCFSKDNIMKMSDGVFHKVFDEVAKEYKDIEANHMIIDIGSAKLAAKPGMFDVIVTSNLYGDIISDIAAEVCGSVGLAGSANIGQEYALFEAIHGSAPDIAGKNIANPSGLINGAIMMLVHIGQPEIASRIQNALYKTIEDGIHTADIYNPNTSSKKVGTKEFADEVIKRLGEFPSKLPKAAFTKSNPQVQSAIKLPVEERKQLVGVDVYIDYLCDDADIIANKVNDICKGKLRLQVISAKGLAVWPKKGSFIKTMDDHWRLRFVPLGDDKTAKHTDIHELLGVLINEGFDIIKTENLYTFDDKLGFSLGQGE